MVIAHVQTSLAIKEIGDVATLGGGGGGVEPPYESDGDALLKVKIKPQGRPMWVWLKLKLTPTLINPFAPGVFAEKHVLKLVEWFSGHCHAIKS